MAHLLDIEHMTVETLVVIANDLSTQIDSLDDPLTTRPMMESFTKICNMVRRDVNGGDEYLIENVRAVQNW